MVGNQGDFGGGRRNSRIIICENLISNDNSNVVRPQAAIVDMEGAQQARYRTQTKSYLSLDGMFLGFSPFGSALDQARYPVACNSNVISNILSNSIPLSNSNSNTPDLNDFITIWDLNPYQNPTGSGLMSRVADQRSDTSSAGFITDVVGHGDMSKITNHKEYFNDYRAVALRGPLVLSSWGYDTEGYPVPNKEDNPDDARRGIYVGNSNSNLHPYKFMDNHLRRPDTWVTAPIDLRYDRERCVWVGGSGFAGSMISNNLMCGPDLAVDYDEEEMQVLGHYQGSEECSWINVLNCASASTPYDKIIIEFTEDCVSGTPTVELTDVQGGNADYDIVPTGETDEYDITIIFCPEQPTYSFTYEILCGMTTLQGPTTVSGTSTVNGV